MTANVMEKFIFSEPVTNATSETNEETKVADFFESESGELDSNDIDASDIPDAAVEDDDDLDSFGNFLILFFQNKMSVFFRIRLDNSNFDF